MKNRDLDDVKRQAVGTRGEGMGKKAQEEMSATIRAVDEEKGIRSIKDQEYGVMQDELRGASELMPVTRPPTGGIQSMARGGGDDLLPPESFTGRDYGYLNEIGPARSATYIERIKKLEKGNEVIPEFSSKNLAMKEMENGVPSGYTLDTRAGYMGPRISTEGDPLKLKDITFGQLDETQKGVYSAVKNSEIEEFSDPGVLADLMDYTRRAGRGKNPDEIVSEYWSMNGNNIRTYLDDIKSGMGPDGPKPGQTMDLFLD